MSIKPHLQSAIGPAIHQLELSLTLLNASPLNENQRFHLRQVEEILCATGALPEEEEP